MDTVTDNLEKKDYYDGPVLDFGVVEPQVKNMCVVHTEHAVLASSNNRQRGELDGGSVALSHSGLIAQLEALHLGILPRRLHEDGGVVVFYHTSPSP